MNQVVGGLGLIAVLAAAAVPSCAAPACVDSDGDGYGEGCAKGADCDDSDSTRAKTCSVVNCKKQPYGLGCPCQGSAGRTCFSGAPEATGYGACRAGTQYCVVGQWSSCDGEIAPEGETCNGLDDDCDGRLDEGVLSPCGGCDSNCVGAVWGSDDLPFVPRDPLVLSETGELTLSYEVVSHSVVWVANTDEGTLSRIDANALRETARFALPGQPWRVAVDYEGAAFVLSQSASKWFLSKVAEASDRCVDQDGDGLDTSQGLDDVLALGTDECVLWTTPVASADGAALALAVDGTRVPDGPAGGDVWVGTALPPKIRRFSGASGTLGESVKLPSDAAPHDAAFDALGTLWVADQRGQLLRLDYQGSRYRVTAVPVPQRCHELEALAIDALGRPVLSTFSCESVLRFEPSSNRFSETPAPGLLSTRGIAAFDDSVFVVHTAAAMSQLAVDPLAFSDTISLEGSLGRPVETAGLATDGTGSLWVTSRGGGDSDVGLLTRVDSSSFQVTGQLDVGRGPRALGDFVGGRLAGSYTAQQGTVLQRFAGCGGGTPTQWLAVHIRYLGGEGAEISVAARHAESTAQLSMETFVPIGTAPRDSLPFSLASLPTGGVLELKVTLSSNAHIGAPHVSQVGVQWQCPGPS